MGPGRVAVFGDVGGCLSELRRGLERLGATFDDGRAVLPSDLVVLQVGDLVHRGPDSDGVVALVDTVMEHQPGQWLQLAGNHEAQYLRDPMFAWIERLPPPTAATLRRWWSDGSMRAAAVIHTPHAAVLATHAGLTRGFWTWLESPRDPITAASRLNDLARSGHDALYRTGSMLGGGAARMDAGPLWADAAAELVASWGRSSPCMPFDQVHGHSSEWDWDSGRARVSADFADRLEIDEAAKHSRTRMPGNHLILGCDPCHGERPRIPWAPIVFEQATAHVP